MIKLIAAEDNVTLERVWRGTCQQLGRKEEFRALNMIDAHIKDLLERRIIRETERERYTIR